MAALIPKAFISDLLEKIDIVDVISQRVELKKRGTNHLACCPFHNEKSPSFNVNQHKQFYHCFGCGVSGDAIQFLMEFERLSFVEAIELLARQAGVSVPYEQGKRPEAMQEQDHVHSLLETINQFYQQQLTQSTQAQAYLQNRGLSPEVIRSFGIGFAPDAWRECERVCGNFCGNRPQNRQHLLAAGMLIAKDNGQPYDRFRNRVMFPIINRRGKMIGFGGRVLGNDNPKYLNSPETPWFHKGRELYGLYQAQTAIREHKEIIIVEGYMDVVAMYQFGIKHCVATLGTAATTAHLQLLKRYAKQLIFCFDGDKAGRAAAWRALENSLPIVHEGIQIQFMFLPEGEDPDSFLQHQGTEAFMQQKQQAMPLSAFFIKHLADSTDIHSIDGKNQLAQTAKPLLASMTESVYKALLVEQLAKVLTLEQTTLKTMLGIPVNTNQSGTRQTSASPYGKQSIRQPRRQPSTPSPIRLAITYLLHYPALAQFIADPDLIKGLPINGGELLHQLLVSIQAQPSMTTASLLQTFADHPQHHALKKLALMELSGDEDGLKGEFMDIMHRLQQQQTEKRIEQLLSKSALHGLTNDERKTLQQLITQQHSTGDSTPM